MNIDLRNISPDFEKQVNRIKKEFDINVNSKAVEHCVVNYLEKLGEIEALKNKLQQKNDELNKIQSKLNLLKEGFDFLLK